MSFLTMHNSVKDEILNWYNQHIDKIEQGKIADLGSYDINGAVRDVIPQSIGFDILEGKGVDVVIKPGIIPDEHKFQYDFVTSTSSFQCCPDTPAYIKQITDLLKSGGELILTMCSTRCPKGHSTSPNDYNYKDEVRYSIEQIRSLFGQEFDIHEIYEKHDGHSDLILKARKK